MREKKTISMRQFNFLSMLNNPTEEDKKKMQEYLSVTNAPILIKNVENDKIEPIEGQELNKVNFWKMFKFYYKLETGKDFIVNEHTSKNIEAILKYFLKDETFFKCDRLLKSFKGVKCENSFEKGLLIIGNNGNGKTSIMRSISRALNDIYLKSRKEIWNNGKQWRDIRFLHENCHDVVTKFELIKEHHDKDLFYEKYSGYRYFFDDFTKESIASNFGKRNIMREVLEKRYDKKSKTYLSMNYDDRYPNDLEQALYSIGLKYGSHLYDRTFEMFNIIQFEGKSFRK